MAPGPGTIVGAAVIKARRVSSTGCGEVKEEFRSGHSASGPNSGIDVPFIEKEQDYPTTDVGILCQRIKEAPLKSLMLVLVPLGWMAAKNEIKVVGGPGWAPPWLVFWLNFGAIIPLSSFLGLATEDISSYSSQIMAGLLNATFGNVVEMMISFSALHKGQLEIVKATLLGSILSNLLFVLGSCFIYAGSRPGKHELEFNSKVGSTCTSLLLLASASLVLPTSLHHLVSDRGDIEELLKPVSRGASIVIFFIYLQFLYFQLVSHKDYFADSDEEEEEGPYWSRGFSILMLGISTVLTAFSADFLVGAIEGYSTDLQLSKEFIGLILVASVGNIPEFYVSLMAAANNHLDLALTIAIGSCCQMALLVTPLAVIAAWAMDINMTLDFHGLQMLCLILAVLVVSSIIQTGKATWLHGSLLVGMYAIITMIFLFLPKAPEPPVGAAPSYLPFLSSFP